jgi:hypothetical protein
MRQTLEQDPSVMASQPQKSPVGASGASQGFNMAGPGPGQREGLPGRGSEAPRQLQQERAQEDQPPAPGFGERLAASWEAFRPRLLMATGLATKNPMLYQAGQRLWEQQGVKASVPAHLAAQQAYERGDTQGAINAYDQWLQQAVTSGNVHPGAIEDVLKQRMGLGNMMAGQQRYRAAISQIQDPTNPLQVASAMIMGGADPKAIGETLAAVRDGRLQFHMDPNFGVPMLFNPLKGEVTVPKVFSDGTPMIRRDSFSKEQNLDAQQMSQSRFPDMWSLWQAAERGDTQAKGIRQQILQKEWDRLEQTRQAATSNKIPESDVQFFKPGELPQSGLAKDVDPKIWEQVQARKAQFQAKERSGTAAAVAAAVQPILNQSKAQDRAAQREEELDKYVFASKGWQTGNMVYNTKTMEPMVGAQNRLRNRDLQTGAYSVLNHADNQMMQYGARADQQFQRMEQLIGDVYGKTEQERKAQGLGSNWNSAAAIYLQKYGINPQNKLAEFETLNNMLIPEISRIESGQARLLVTMMQNAHGQLPGPRDNFETASTRIKTMRRSLLQLRQGLMGNPAMTPFGEMLPGSGSTVKGQDEMKATTGEIIKMR